VLIRDSFREKTVGFLLVGGALVVIVTLIATWMFAMAGFLHGTLTREPITNRITDAGDLNLMPLCLLFFTIGIGMIGGGIGYGIWKERTKFVGIPTATPNTRVIARYILNEEWAPIAEYEADMHDNPHYMVRIEIEQGHSEEFEAHPETYFQCGEGMAGESVFQGKWLCRFAPYIGVRPG